MVVFLTDWGYDSHYVGVAKAAIKKVNKSIEILDISHSIKPFNVKHAAYIVQRTIKDLPEGTVFLAVVDPGVGTARKPMVMVLKNGLVLVGPDNGIFTFAAEDCGVHEIRELENQSYYNGKSRSFHGRDIFAPVAAHIENGLEIEKLGPRLMNYEYLRYRKASKKESTLTGEVAFYDHFGNLQTNIPLALGEDFEEGDTLEVRGRKKPIKASFGKTYYDVNQGQLLAHFDSSGFLELAVNKGSARETLGIEEGEPITIAKI